jgi:hypothetical protein
MPSAILTTEFLIPTTIPQQWFDDLKRVWNESLFYLNWLQHYKKLQRFNCADLPPVEIKLCTASEINPNTKSRTQQRRNFNLFGGQTDIQIIPRVSITG